MDIRNIPKDKNVISVVVYVRNNESEIEHFLLSVNQILETVFDTFEIVLVNDSSSDRTIDKVKAIISEVKGNVTVVNLAWQHGLELSMLAGLDIAIGDFVFEFDSPVIDYELDEIIEVYKKSLQGYDIVAAASSSSLNISSKLFYRCLEILSYRNMKLTTETFRIISRRALNRILSSKEKTRYRKALYHYSGFETSIIKYEATSQSSRRSIRLSDRIKTASDVLISFTNIGIRAATTLSFVFLLIALSMLGYTIYSYIAIENIQPGWTTIMLFLSFSFSGLFFILAILAKYITVLLIEVQEKPVYVYKSLEKLSYK